MEFLRGKCKCGKYINSSTRCFYLYGFARSITRNRISRVLYARQAHNNVLFMSFVSIFCPFFLIYTEAWLLLGFLCTHRIRYMAIVLGNICWKNETLRAIDKWIFWIWDGSAEIRSFRLFDWMELLAFSQKFITHNSIYILWFTGSRSYIKKHNVELPACCDSTFN